MPALLTLADVKVGLVDDLQTTVIDELVKSTYLFEKIGFEPVASLVGGGAGWSYAYNKVKEESTSEFRDINGKYTDSVALTERKNVDLKILGGSFSIDRALRDTGGAPEQVAFQLAQKIKAVKAGFCNAIVNGAVIKDSKQFDGLDALITGSSTEIVAGGTGGTGFDLSTFTKVKDNAAEFVAVLDDFLSILVEKPDALMGNSKMINKIKAIAKIVGTNTETKDDFGRSIDAYDGIALIDLGEYNGAPVVEINAGETSLYAVKFGAQAFHAISPAGASLVDTIAPDFTQASEQVRGLIELRAAVVLKHSKSCGVLRKIKVQ